MHLWCLRKTQKTPVLQAKQTLARRGQKTRKKKFWATSEWESNSYMCLQK